MAHNILWNKTLGTKHNRNGWQLANS